MREMNKAERKQIEYEVFEIIRSAVGSDYAKNILNNEDGISGKSFLNDIIQNVLEASAWEDEGYYNDDDIRLAIGRELMIRLKIEVGHDRK